VFHHNTTSSALFIIYHLLLLHNSCPRWTFTIVIVFFYASRSLSCLPIFSNIKINIHPMTHVLFPCTCNYLLPVIYSKIYVGNFFVLKSRVFSLIPVFNVFSFYQQLESIVFELEKNWLYVNSKILIEIFNIHWKASLNFITCVIVNSWILSPSRNCCFLRSQSSTFSHAHADSLKTQKNNCFGFWFILRVHHLYKYLTIFSVLNLNEVLISLGHLILLLFIYFTGWKVESDS